MIDNYSVHTCERVQQELEAFAAAGITLGTSVAKMEVREVEMA